jgi:hypothetical protein
MGWARQSQHIIKFLRLGTPVPILDWITIEIRPLDGSVHSFFKFESIYLVNNPHHKNIRKWLHFLFSKCDIWRNANKKYAMNNHPNIGTQMKN